MNPKVGAYIERSTRWHKELSALRKLLVKGPLTEELKWGKPCYTLDGKNVVLLVAFKEYCAMLFTQGALLSDPNGVLVQPTENTQAARQARFTDVKGITKMRSALTEILNEAIEVKREGKTVAFKAPTDFAIPEELQKKFDASPAFKRAFEALTPGRQRGYNLHFSAAKQSKTREARIEKCAPKILEGKGLNDR